MQILLLYFFLFLVGCVFGWVLEVFFRRFFSAKKWVNPGFMKGPWLPLYGFGLVVMFTVSYLIVSLSPEEIKFYNPLGGLFGRDYVSGPAFADILPISVMWIGMVILEFLAGLIFIKGFRVKLWDYSNMKGNILGIVCPVFTFLWLVVAVVFYYLIDPYMFVLSTEAHVYMFGGDGALAHFGFIFVIGIAYGLMIYDLATSIGLMSAVSKFAKQSGIADRYENLKSKFEELGLSSKKFFKSVKNDGGVSSAIKEKIAEVIYIDPEKEKDKSANYDESGRPMKTE